MRTRTLLISILALMCATASFAQHSTAVQQRKLENNHRIAFFGEGETDTIAASNLINQFYMDQFRHVHDPRAPYFMLMSRTSKMAMGIGGTIQALAFYDWHGPISGADFSPYNIAIPTDPARPNLFQTSIGHSALFFTVFGNSAKFGTYKFYLEAKFLGGNGSHFFKLNKAYATVGDWTLGYATSTFSDPASQPNTVETDGPNSEIGDTRVLVRYMHNLKGKWMVAASLETPNDQVAPATAQYEAGSAYMPNFAAFLQYGEMGQHIRIAGIVKGMRYRNLVKSENGYVTGWGLNLSTVFKPINPVTVYAAANYGQGIGSFVNDLDCGTNDMIGLATDPGKMYAPRSYGWYVACQYNFRPNLYSTLIFSQERILPKDGSVYGGDQYKYGLYGVANVFWEITPRCTVGAELDLGKRANIDREHRADYRIGMLAQFNF